MKRSSVASEASSIGVCDVPKPSTILAITCSSIDLDIGGLADRRPFLEVRRDEGTELCGRAGLGDRAELGDGVLHFRRLEALVDRGVELVDDRRGRPLRC